MSQLLRQLESFEKRSKADAADEIDLQEDARRANRLTADDLDACTNWHPSAELAEPTRALNEWQRRQGRQIEFQEWPPLDWKTLPFTTGVAGLACLASWFWPMGAVG